MNETYIYPVLKRLQETEINVDELDYLAKRLESFDRYELAQFQGTAVSQEFVNMTDFINLTFCCQGVTVVQDFTDLEDVGRNHCLNLHGGITTDELQSLNFQEIALSLLQNKDGIITPYGKKTLAKERKKKIAMGGAPDDHEDEEYTHAMSM